MRGGGNQVPESEKTSMTVHTAGYALYS